MLAVLEVMTSPIANSAKAFKFGLWAITSLVENHHANQSEMGELGACKGECYFLSLYLLFGGSIRSADNSRGFVGGDFFSTWCSDGFRKLYRSCAAFDPIVCSSVTFSCVCVDF